MVANIKQLGKEYIEINSYFFYCMSCSGNNECKFVKLYKLTANLDL